MRRFGAVLVAVVAMVGSVAAAAAVSGAKAAPAPARVHALAAGHATAHGVTLTWRNPDPATFRRTEIRVRRGSVAPVSVTDGRHLGGRGRAGHSFRVTGLAAATRYSFAVFTVDAHGHAGPRAVTRATTLLAPAALPRAYESAGGVRLRWHNPAHGLTRVGVRVLRGQAAPTRLSQGRRVAARGNSALVTGLAPDTAYAASIFAVDRYGRAAAPAVVRFTTAPKADPAEPPKQPGSYTGKVVDSDGSPLTGARVIAYSQSGRSHPVRTDAAGGFVLPLAPGRWYVVVDGDRATGGNSATGYVANAGFGTPVTIRPGAVVRGQDIVLRAGAEVEGRIVDTHGRPRNDVVVYPAKIEPYVQGDGGGVYALNFADGPNVRSDGRWTLRGVDPDVPFRMCGLALGDGITGFALLGGATHCSRRGTVVAAGTRTTLPDLAVPDAPAPRAGGAVVGTLRRPDGRPVAGQAVLLPERADDDYVIAQAGSNGRFVLRDAAPGRYRVCGAAAERAQAVSATGYLANCTAPLHVQRAATLRKDVRLRRGAAAAGKVTDRSGRGVADVSVIVSAASKSGDPDDDPEDGAEAEATTDRHGFWRVKGLAAGPHTACFSGTAVRRPATGTLPGCWRGGAEFATFAGTRRIGVDTVLAPGGAVAGVVTDAAGRPVPEASVGVYTDSTFASATTDGRGRYTLRGLAPGRVAVCLFALDSGEPTRCSAPVTVRPGHVGRANLRMPVPTGVTVEVKDDQGMPVAGVDAAALAGCREDDRYCAKATVFADGAPVDIAASGVTDTHGRLTITDLDPGRYAVCLFAYYGTTVAGGSPTGYADTCHGQTFDIVVRKGRVTSIAMTLAQGGALSGSVRNPAGRPVGDVRVAVSGSAAEDYPLDPIEALDPSEDDIRRDGPRRDSRTAADGTFSIIGVQPGRRTVCAIPSPGTYLAQCAGGKPGAEHGGTPVGVTAGQTTGDVNLAVSRGGTLAGRTRVAGALRRGVYVAVFRGRHFSEDPFDPNGQSYAESRADGRWSLGGLPPGTYTVCAVSHLSGRCWRNTVWPEPGGPPPRKATLITLGLGTTRTGIDFALPR